MVDVGNVFRGKSVGFGRWIVGFYSGPCGAKLIDAHWISELNDPCGTQFRVDPATVGECTKIKDKNGEWIFEGDILGAYLDESNPGHEARVTVVWLGNGWGMKAPYCDKPDQLEVDDGEKYGWAVIGNIYDNPELVEVEHYGPIQG